MPLPLDLQLSQGSLQDFVDCRRRFQLRHVLHQAWPAVTAEPALETERHLRQGEAFHRMIQQHLLGVPAERLSQMAAATPDDAELACWWRNYMTSAPAGAAGAPRCRAGALCAAGRAFLGGQIRPDCRRSTPARGDLRLEDIA